MKTEKISWGIIGCGNIANKFACDITLVEDAILTAVASRDLDKANVFAAQHKALNSYGSYTDLFSDPNIDIVYIATPHVFHAELSIQAMAAGKHVLCEKPLALNALEAAKMIETSKRTNRFFMEALWTRFNPTIVDIIHKIQEGAIGEIKYINADFSFMSTKPLDGRVMNLEFGGGSLLDIGIYPAFLAYTLLGKPNDILAKANFHKLTKCDMQTAMIFSYHEAQAVLYSGFESNSDSEAHISGTEGQIYIHKRWHEAKGYTLVKNDQRQVFEFPINGIGFTYEIEECHKCLRAGKIESELWSHQNCLDLISILDAVRVQVGLKYPQE